MAYSTLLHTLWDAKLCIKYNYWNVIYDLLVLLNTVNQIIVKSLLFFKGFKKIFLPFFPFTENVIVLVDLNEAAEQDSNTDN